MSDWQRVQSIFHTVADIPSHERPPLLDSLCGGDAALCAEVQSLLAADSGSAVTIDSAIQGIASTILDSPDITGQRIGVYRIIRELGRGGMGVVYLALRDDEEYTREVALKVANRGMNTAEALSRFRDERQILANLDHPYIARLFDGGTTAEGIPFFAMEYVEGQPVDAFCRENGLDASARCELFLHILDAVSYAHRNLVIHGDLKPANIFVTAEGTPKLLDFGVAKLVGRKAGVATSADAEATAFTPGYASPEQARGLAVTISSDVYSLGAVFYELLSGRRSQPIDFGTPTGIERAVCDSGGSRPSLVARHLPADLSDVVLMALRKEPDLRYRSAAEFAADIRRSLQGRPVSARPHTLGYRFRRFTQRNRLQVAMASTVVLALVAGLFVSMHQTRLARADRARADGQRQIALLERAQAEAARASEAQQRTRADQQRSLADQQRSFADQQRTLAEHERDEAQSQKSLADQRLKDILQLADRTLFDVHDAIAPLPGSIPARRMIVETTLDYLKTLENNVGKDDDMREALSGAYYKVATLQADPRQPSLQDTVSAEKSLRKALELLRPPYRRHPDDPNLMMRWIDVNASLSELMYRAGRVQPAIQIYLDLIPIAHRLAGITPCIPTCESQESTVENNVANEWLVIDAAQALQHAERGITLARATSDRHPADPALKQQLAVIVAVAAAAYRNLGNLDKASEYFQQSIQLREGLLHDNPTSTGIRRNLLVAYANYAMLLGVPWAQNLNHPAEARDYASRAVAIARDFVKADSADATARRDLGMALGRLGMIDPAPGDTAGSLAHLEEATSLIDPIVAANPKMAEYIDQLAEIMEFKALRLAQMGRPADAMAVNRRAIAMLEPFLAPTLNFASVEYVSHEEALAELEAANGTGDEGIRLANKAVADAQQMAKKQSTSESRIGYLAAAYSALAVTQSNAGHPDVAREPAHKALQIWASIQQKGILTSFRRQMEAAQSILAASPSH